MNKRTTENFQPEQKPGSEQKADDKHVSPAIGNTNVSGCTGIEWRYFFGGSGGNTFDRYYEAVIKGTRVEKHASNAGTLYAIGNIDKTNKKYKTETELLNALNKINVKDAKSLG